MCGVGEYLDYKSCKCRKSLVDKLVESSSAEECTENIDAEKIAGMVLFKQRNDCVCSCTIYVVLIVIIFTINIGIGAFFACSRWYLKKDVICVKFGTRTQTAIRLLILQNGCTY